MKRYRFYFSDHHQWNFDLPEYISKGGPAEDLIMKLGGEIVIAWLAEERKEIFLEFSDKPFHEDNRPMYKTTRPAETGCYYLFAATDLITDHWDFWLSDAFQFIFKGFPNVIYYRVVDEKDNTSVARN